MDEFTYQAQYPFLDEVDSIGECTSLLHPDHAWTAGSRRGSSQSETLEVEVYQLGKDFSRSLPGSRRSSFQQQQEKGISIVPSVQCKKLYPDHAITTGDCIIRIRTIYRIN